MTLPTVPTRSSPQGDGFGNGPGANSDEVGECVKRELDVLRRIEPHTSIIAVVEYPTGGHTLERLPYSFEEACELMTQKEPAQQCIERQYEWCHDLSDALAHMHSQGFVHGRINAGNLRFTENYDLKLVKFSMAQEVGREQHEAVSDVAASSAGGKPDSERRACTDHAPTKENDIYDLGTTMWEVMSLQPDKESKGEEHSLPKNTTLEGPMGELIDLCRHVDPSKRISPYEAAHRIQEIIEDEGGKARSP